MDPAELALEKLIEGNRRFVAGKSAEIHRTHRLVDDQKPFAIIVGCSDSRVPPEIVFDQGVGDMFVIRIAGNIVTPLELGSIEFAAIKFGPRLVVVLGHSCCGAVQATVSAIQEADSKAAASRSPELSEGMQTIVEHIGVSVDLNHDTDFDRIVEHTVDQNVRNSVARIRNGSTALEDLISNQGMVVVGATYALETGEVVFLDGDG